VTGTKPPYWLVLGDPFGHPSQDRGVRLVAYAADGCAVQPRLGHETEGHAGDTETPVEERDDSKPMGGAIQLDDMYWGGERRGGKRGRGAANKVPLVAAMPLNGDGHPISMDMAVVKGFRLAEIARSIPGRLLKLAEAYG
jgi:hypothetical protein